ncbi:MULTISPECIES: bifunctional 2-polyprenyl-6-hydroxyphenol methylase/3-demethylubiquinol 3-O-methyltransferase UbiG [unclassified Lentimicrobium]|uniref:class I SAM-dependent methyltransferase n=1 Tax=unclassified Lentimicrobium TaxID=2677434 RepID=UPI001556FD4E|nr:MULTISPECIES: class I SAM-dependent methyltransferase [unclassified Lentimicrobium]NPD45555.1 class I SAM-dependent methyltransferase [Lentimicrobium sp. S6]NPD83634.1 class I SAM-dependent methyltransferase [Lentimicrobium sp. L6]
MPRKRILSKNKMVSMSDDWYELTDIDHFWLQWRFRIFAQLIHPFLKNDSQVFEIGCGNGIVMKQFENTYHQSIAGCDLNQFAIDHIIEDLKGTVYTYDIHDRHKDLLEKFDIIILFDVIEHIEDEKYFIESALAHLKKGGKLIINVPAHQWLYSRYDKIVGHLKRYNKKDINAIVNQIDGSSVNHKYWGFSLIPLLLVRKLYLVFQKEENVISKGFKPPHPLVNSITKLIMKLETAIPLNLPIGASLMSVIDKE